VKPFRLIALVTLVLSSAVVLRPAARDIYPDPAQAKGEIAAALKAAAQTHRRILLDFGGNWCGDCQVLDIYFHNAQNKPILDSNFVLVHVNVGEYDANLDLAEKYEIPLKRGVPAIAVLSETGKLLYSQKSGEFESMRRLDATAVTRFLVQWKPAKQGCSVMMVNC
jgi:thiol:disulfide interchange protein